MTLTVLNRFIVLLLNGSLVLAAVALAYFDTAWITKLPSHILVAFSVPATAAALIVGLAVDGLAAITFRSLLTYPLTDTAVIPWPVRFFVCRRDWAQYQFHLEHFHARHQQHLTSLHEPLQSVEKALADSVIQPWASWTAVARGTTDRAVGYWSVQAGTSKDATSLLLSRALAAAHFMSDTAHQDSTLVSSHWLLYILSTDLSVTLITVATVTAFSPVSWATTPRLFLVGATLLLVLRSALVHYLYAYEIVLRHCSMHEIGLPSRAPTATMFE